MENEILDKINKVSKDIGAMHRMLKNEVTIRKSPFLPIDEVVEVYDIETRQKCKVITGKKIDCVKIGREFVVSPSMYDAIMEAIAKRIEEINQMP